MLDLDSVAMYLGYGTMFGTAGALATHFALKTYPEKTTEILVKSVAKCNMACKEISSIYQANVSPILAAYKHGWELIFSSHEPTHRIFLLKDGKKVISFPEIEDARAADVADDSYDMAVYCFNDDYPVTTIRKDYISEFSDDFKISSCRFLNVTLHINDDCYTLNLEKPSMFYVENNIILDAVFVDWIAKHRLGLDGIPNDYKVTVIDSNVNQHTLVNGDAIRITRDGYILLEDENKENETKNENEQTSGTTENDENTKKVEESKQEIKEEKTSSWFSWNSKKTK